MAEANCINCGDAFEPEHSEDEICSVCYEHELAIDIESSASQELPDSHSECAECGAELYDFFHGDNQLCEVCGGY